MIDLSGRATGFADAWRWAAGMLAAAGAILVLAPAAQAGVVPSGFQDQVAFSGLTEPTTLSFAPDGRVFVAEKSGLIKVFDGMGDTTPTTVADLRTDVYNYWDRGLLGMALDPQFPTRPYLYVLYTRDALPGGNSPHWGAVNQTSESCNDGAGGTGDGCVVTGRLARLTLSGNGVTDQTNLITDWCQQFPSHSIGDLGFGPDGALYVTAGEGANFSYADWGQTGNPCGDPGGPAPSPPNAEGGSLRSQDPRTTGDPTGLDGTLLRIDPDTGEGLPGNPYYATSTDANQRRIAAFGFRNPFRFTVRPGTGEVWVGDVGWVLWEEIDRVTDPAGTAENFGWPCYEGSNPQPDFQPKGLSLCDSLYAGGGADDPYFAYPHLQRLVDGEGCDPGSSSISGLAFEQGSAYPASYQGALFFADYSRNCIWAMMPGGNGLPDPENIVTFDDGAPGPVSLEFGPDGALYYPDLNDGEIHRISRTTAPIAVAEAHPPYGPTPLTVQLDASGSSDPDGDTPLSFAWDLDGDGQFDDSTVAAPTWTYYTAVNQHPTVRVTDTDGESSTASVEVQPGNTPPTAQIETPSSTDLWKVGDEIAFSGTGHDDEQSLPDSAYHWDIVLNHCPSSCHQHPLESFDGVTGGTFPVPDVETPSYLTFRLRVTDDRGLTGTDSVDIHPGTVQPSASPPPGTSVPLGATAKKKKKAKCRKHAKKRAAAAKAKCKKKKKH